MCGVASAGAARPQMSDESDFFFLKNLGVVETYLTPAGFYKAWSTDVPLFPRTWPTASG